MKKDYSPRKHEIKKARNFYYFFFVFLSFRAFVINLSFMIPACPPQVVYGQTALAFLNELMQFIDGRFCKFGIIDMHVNHFNARPVRWRYFETRFQTFLKPGIRFGFIDRSPDPVELAESPAGDKNRCISF